MSKTSDLAETTEKMMSLWQDYLAKTTGMEGMQTLAAATKDPMAWAKMMTEFNHAAMNPFDQFANRGHNEKTQKGQSSAAPSQSSQDRAETVGTASDGHHVLLLQLVSRLADVERRLADLESRDKKAV